MGSSWKVKKLQRLKEQAKENGQDFKELVMNHFGVCMRGHQGAFAGAYAAVPRALDATAL